MKIAVSSTGTMLDDKVHDLFGRCDFFVFVDTASMESRAVKNPFTDAATGAGTACVQIIFDEGAKAVISGKVGPNAYEVLTQGEIDIFLSPPGVTVKEAVTKYKDGSLRKMELKRY